MFQFKINDYIMYGTTGVCQVMGITEEQFLDDEARDYYVLNPVYSNQTTIKIPVQTQLNARYLHSKDEVADFIKKMPSNELFWIDDERQRHQTFKSMLKKLDCESLIMLINSIYSYKNKIVTPSKKVSKQDEEIMKVAEHLLNQEFATILGIEPSEVTDYILEQVSH
ncbi:MAG: CarD family transcriptional regulator [Turicibacter sp.]|nr:CarD family transcriptional regulator [Turicibacter sp.]